jgi:hypothetical protein
MQWVILAIFLTEGKVKNVNIWEAKWA